jgi:hypothetical protein
MEIEDISGVWIIEEMSNWNEDYFNMEVQAHIRINSNFGGSFQFGLVAGGFDGEVYEDENRKLRFEATWKGNDECDEASGFLWIQQISKTRIKGEFRMHQGDNSTFEASRENTQAILDIFDSEDREKRIEKILKDKGLTSSTKNFRKYLSFLKENISLPIEVTGTDYYFQIFGYKFKRGEAPSGNDNYEIIEFEDDLEHSSNIFVKVRRLTPEGGIFSLQLFEFETVHKGIIEHRILADYTYWVENYL